MPQTGRRAGLPQVLTVLAAAAVLLQLYGLYRPGGPPTPQWFPHVDKVEHLLGFAAPVCLILLARRSSRGDLRAADHRRSFAAGLLVVFVLHALLSELVQHYFYGGRRTGDPYDVLADWLGTALGWGVAGLLGPRLAYRTDTRAAGDRPGVRARR